MSGIWNYSDMNTVDSFTTTIVNVVVGSQVNSELTLCCQNDWLLLCDSLTITGHNYNTGISKTHQQLGYPKCVSSQNTRVKRLQYLLSVYSNSGLFCMHVYMYIYTCILYKYTCTYIYVYMIYYDSELVNKLWLRSDTHHNSVVSWWHRSTHLSAQCNLWSQIWAPGLDSNASRCRRR